MKLNRFVAIVVVLCMIFGCTMTASAAGTPSIINRSFHLAEGISFTSTPRENGDVLAGIPEAEIDILDGNARSTSLPTSFCDLSIQNYNARMVTIAYSKLYTNSYFSPDERNELHLSFTVFTTHGGPGNLRVGIYNMSTGAESYIDYSFTDAVSENAYFSNLNQGNHYAIYFQSISNGSGTAFMNGNALIFWPSTYFG